MRLKVPAAVLIAVLIWLPRPGGAGRPLDTEDAGTVDPGSAQVELSGNFAASDPDEAWLVLAKLAIGLVPRLEASVQAAFLAVDIPGVRGETGLGDTSVRVKYRLLDETPRGPALLATVDLRLPTGDAQRGLGDDDVDVLALVLQSEGLVVIGGTTAPPPRAEPTLTSQQRWPRVAPPRTRPCGRTRQGGVPWASTSGRGRSITSASQ
jgi:Putative MetA-pathway of phenol degradation